MMCDTTFAQDIEQTAGDEPIEAIVISKRRDGHFFGDKPAETPIAGRVVSWAEARPYLDYHYDEGSGPQDCHSIYAWTATRVLFVSEYDGATGVVSIPRNPVDCEPESI